MMERLRRSVRPLFQRAPGLRALVLQTIDLAARPLLLPFRLSRPPTDPARVTSLAQQTDEFNRAAETYYAAHADSAQLLDKPFSEPGALARRLIDVGVLIDALRLEPGDTVIELGAGTCWLSQLLNRFGCRTMAVDVSPTALALGRQVFDRDPRTNWSLDPQFLPYDGHTLPAGDASVDRVVLYDAYHHLPNPVHLVREMRRVLRPDGIVAMSEPGRGHAASAPSVAEAAATGVLENELALEDIAELAMASGFSAARVVVAGGTPTYDIAAGDLRAFMGGRGFARYWKHLCARLDAHHYLLLFAGDPMPTTKRPKLLRAEMQRVGAARSATVPRGETQGVAVRLHNAGDTRWLSASNLPGWTRLGAHLYRMDGGPGPARALIDFDWLRVSLPSDVAPEHTVQIQAVLPALEQPGAYAAVLDPVIEGVVWFADRGSRPIEISWTVV